MAICVVVKPFKANGEPFERGQVIDSGELRTESNLISTRYLRMATPEEYAEAAGLTVSFDQQASRKSVGAKEKAVPLSPPDEDEEDDVEEEDAPTPEPKKKPKAAKAAKAVKAKKTVSKKS